MEYKEIAVNRAWEKYKDLTGRSGIYKFMILDEAILVRYNDCKNLVYVYDFQTSSKDKVENMKELAKNGQGLSGYISKNVRKAYKYVFEIKKI